MQRRKIGDGSDCLSYRYYSSSGSKESKTLECGERKPSRTRSGGSREAGSRAGKQGNRNVQDSTLVLFPEYSKRTWPKSVRVRERQAPSQT